MVAFIPVLYFGMPQLQFLELGAQLQPPLFRFRSQVEVEAPQGAEDSEEDSDFEDEPPEATSSNADGRGSGTATNPLGLPLTHNIELKGNPSHLESKETNTELHDVLSCNVNISIVSFPYRKGEIFSPSPPQRRTPYPRPGEL